MTDYTKYVPHQRPTFTSSAPPEKECTTHHHACGCRESRFKEMEAELSALKDAARAVVDNFRGTTLGLVLWTAEIDALAALLDKPQ